MSARHSFSIHIASPLVLVSAACHRPAEPGATNKPAAAASIGARATPSAATSPMHPLSSRERPQEAKALADQVDRLATAGQNFGDLVLKYSDDPAVSANHGNLGQITRQQFEKPFMDAAFALLKMEIGLDPVDTPAGFQIIRRTE